VLLSGGSDAQYLPSGHIVYVTGGKLMAVPFNVEKLEVASNSVPVVDDVVRGSQAAQFSASDNGTLIYQPGALLPAWSGFYRPERSYTEKFRVTGSENATLLHSNRTSHETTWQPRHVPEGPLSDPTRSPL
jgi:hypothetical protein